MNVCGDGSKSTTAKSATTATTSTTTPVGTTASSNGAAVTVRSTTTKSATTPTTSTTTPVATTASASTSVATERSTRGEQCDDGNTVDDDGLRKRLPPSAVCGRRRTSCRSARPATTATTFDDDVCGNDCDRSTDCGDGELNNGEGCARTAAPSTRDCFRCRLHARGVRQRRSVQRRRGLRRRQRRRPGRLRINDCVDELLRSDGEVNNGEDLRRRQRSARRRRRARNNCTIRGLRRRLIIVSRFEECDDGNAACLEDVPVSNALRGNDCGDGEVCGERCDVGARSRRRVLERFCMTAIMCEPGSQRRE